MNNNNRYQHLDVITGLLIIWMIYGDHLRYFSGVQNFVSYNELHKVFYFFMAWFFFKSGMFFSEKRTVTEVAKHDWKKFVVPYLVGCVVAMIVQAVYLLSTGQMVVKAFAVRNVIDALNHGGVSWNIALWFLLSLYIVKIVYRWAVGFAHPLGIAVVSLAVSYTLYYFGIFRPALIGNVPLGLFFYSVGYMLREEQYKKQVFVIALAATAMFFATNMVHTFAFRLNRVGANDIYMIVILASVCSILTFNNLFLRFAPPPVGLCR